MNNNQKDFFQVNCNINSGEKLMLKLPYSVHSDFEKTVSSGDDSRMAKLVELFAEFELLEYAKKAAFQEMIIQRANELSTLDDLLTCMKAVRLCTVFFEGE